MFYYYSYQVIRPGYYSIVVKPVFKNSIRHNLVHKLSVYSLFRKKDFLTALFIYSKLVIPFFKKD